LAALATVLLAVWIFYSTGSATTRAPSFTHTEEGFDAQPEEVATPEYFIGGAMQYSLQELRNWERPQGPTRVGVQIGHYRNDEVPEELSGLTRNGAGATFGAFNERDTVAVIARLVADELEAAGIVVDILPATVPPEYVADAFVSIHADGNTNQSVRGYKMAGLRRDYSGRSEELVAAMYDTYAVTGLPVDPFISRRMTAYYAFNWPRYEHAVHPFTPAVIVETGFLSNADDRAFLVNEPEVAASAISAGVQQFLAAAPSPQPPPLTLEAPTLPLTGTVECAPVRAERRDREARPCQASLRTSAGRSYILNANPPVATSSLPYEATVDGSYLPIQLLDNYFWFHWEVFGVITVESLDRD